MFEQIYIKMIEYLQGDYTVIKSFDAQEEIDLNGVIAVTLDNIENLQHGNIKDYKISMLINAQTFTQQDKDKGVILQMFDYVFEKLNPAEIKNEIGSDCAGVLINTGNLQSDGETNNFSFQVDLFISID